MAGAWSEFVEEYLKLGLSDIVVVDYSHEEERRGYENEKTDETVVAKQKGKFVRFHISLYQNFNPHRPSRDLTPGSVMEITEEEYKKEADGKPVLETKAAAEKLKAAHDLSLITPLCPQHRVSFIVRTNSKTRVKFWGCPRFPNCQASQPFSSEHLRLYTIVSRSTP
jgi:hypothetical protein